MRLVSRVASNYLAEIETRAERAAIPVSTSGGVGTSGISTALIPCRTAVEGYGFTVGRNAREGSAAGPGQGLQTELGEECREQQIEGGSRSGNTAEPMARRPAEECGIG